MPNFLGAKLLVHSRFNVDVWSLYLEHYQDRVIIDFLRYGWPINYQLNILASSSFRSHPSDVKNSPTSQRLVHFAATLSTQTAIFLHYFVFPSVILLSYVVVHDHTFPEGSSVNDGICSDQYLEKFFKLHPPGIDGLVEFVNAKGRCWHVFKKDLRPAYRQIPIDPQDYALLGLYIDGSLFFHTALPFGLRSASMICQRTTKAFLTF